ncbi:hypothetical protein SUDANB145_03124 [Streptomyces sp. enrichment culture]
MTRRWTRPCPGASPNVRAVLVRRAADFAAAEDAVQDALVETVRRWPDGPPRGPKGWLVTVAWREFLDQAGDVVTVLRVLHLDVNEGRAPDRQPRRPAQPRGRLGGADGPRAALAALAELGPARPRHTAAAACLHERGGEPATAARLYAEAVHQASSLAERDCLPRQAARLNTHRDRRQPTLTAFRTGTWQTWPSGAGPPARAAHPPPAADRPTVSARVRPPSPRCPTNYR